MYAKQTTVVNKSGLHARPAADFVKAAAGFKSSIKISSLEQPNVEVNAKSMVMLLSLSVCRGMKIRITAEGADEKTAVDSLVALVDSGFGEN